MFGVQSISIFSFNPHTHAGCDLMSLFFVEVFFGFNPHTHAGCDYSYFVTLTYDNVSIHTPTQGVTDKICSNISIFVVSIHTPTQGVTQEAIVDAG